jgi:hypothetical protein
MPVIRQYPIIPSRAHLGQRHRAIFPVALVLGSGRERPKIVYVGRLGHHVPGLETSVSFDVMNSSSTGMPSLVF